MGTKEKVFSLLQAMQMKAEMESKIGITFAPDKTEAKLMKLNMHSELKKGFLDSSRQRMSQAESGTVEAPPSLGVSESKAKLEVFFGDAIMKKTNSSPELNSPDTDEATLQPEEESEQRANSICNGEANASSREKRSTSLRDPDP